MNEEMPAKALLVAAARLVSRALGKLDTSSRPCRACGRPHFANPVESKVMEQLANVPDRLMAAAEKVGHGDK